MYVHVLYLDAMMSEMPQSAALAFPVVAGCELVSLQCLQ